MNAAQSEPLHVLAFPLTDFYTHAGLPLPPMEAISSEAVPEPYKALLAAGKDMTPGLEEFHKSRLHLETLKRDRRGNFYFCEIVLRLDHDEKPVEFGAIKIFLGRFPEEAQEFILAEQIPLCRVLKDCGIMHHIEARAFFRFEPDAVISEALELETSGSLYGRKAVILDRQGRPLSEMVEILPPIAGMNS